MNRTANILMAIINVILYGLMVAVNALANALPINGKTTGALSGQYPNLFVPAGLTFSIWGVIYVLLLLLVIQQLVASIRGSKNDMMKPFAGVLFGLTCLLNACWIFAWHFEVLIVSAMIMIALLITLLYLFSFTDKMSFSGWFGKLAVKVSISVYLGWISIATIANITSLLIDIDWDAFHISDVIWTVVMITVGALLTIAMLALKKNIPFALVVIWAYTGIIIKRSTQDIVYSKVIYASYVAIAIILLMILYVIIQWFRKQRKTKAKSDP